MCGKNTHELTRVKGASDGGLCELKQPYKKRPSNGRSQVFGGGLGFTKTFPPTYTLPHQLFGNQIANMIGAFG